MTKQNITLIGCGNMGGALLRGWLSAGINAAYAVLDPHAMPEDLKHSAVTHHLSAETLPQNADMLLLAVKPQIMEAACQSVKNALADETLILSIAAGKTIAGFEKHFGAHRPIIRTMPNTPAAIGKGITVGVGNAHVTPAHKKLAEQFLSVTGAFEWVEDESLMDAVTAVSGSGPAYLFHLVEALSAAAKNLGLSEETAEKLAWHTVVGSAALLESDPSISPSTRRAQVTSPNGTTAAGLEILMPELTDLLTRTVQAAEKRGRELGR